MPTESPSSTDGTIADGTIADAAAAQAAAAAGASARAIRDLVADIYREESRRVLATLIRLLGDFDLAEEALHDAFTAALETWARDGVPRNPRGWLVSTGRF